MEVTLDKKDLILLVKGSCPNYNVFAYELVKKTGRYVGGFVDKWEWDQRSLELLSEEQLWLLYLTCKNSW